MDDKLEPVGRGLIEPGEELRGVCVATQQSLFKGRMVALAVTDRRLVLQGLTRRFEPEGEPLSLPPEKIAEAKAEGGGGGWINLEAAIMDEVSVTLRIRTTDGEKLKLMMMRAEGAAALGAWFASHSP